MTRLATLHLPLRAPRVAWATSAVAFVSYCASASWDLSLYDSPELALVAHELGLGHPIGAPLHTLIGATFSNIPGIPPLVGLTLLSAIPMALTAIPMFGLAERMFYRALEPPPLRAQLIAAAVVLAGLVHFGAWESATRVEVYPLATFLALWSLARFAADPHRTLAAGAALGLAATAHVIVAAALALPLFLVLIAQAVRAKNNRFLPIARFAGGFVIGLLPYAYVPLIAHRSDEVLLWGAPRDFDQLRAYLAGADYRSNQGISASLFFDHVLALGRWSLGAQPLLALLLGAFAHLRDPKNPVGRGAALAYFLLVFCFVASNVVFHPDVTDYLGYLIAPTLALTAGAAALLRDLEQGRHRTAALVLGPVLLFMNAALPISLLNRTRTADHVARSIGEVALDEAPERAFVIVEADHWIAPLLYLQEAEGARPDVIVLGYGLASSSWYWNHVRARHIDLAPFELEGDGGSAGRVRRMIDASPDRAILVDSAELAARLGLNICDVGILVHAGVSCGQDQDQDQDHGHADRVTRIGSRGSGHADRLSDVLAALMTEVDRGSPPAHEVLAHVASTRGTALFRLGRTEDAYLALLAGVLPDQLPPLSAPPGFERPVALTSPLPTWKVRMPIYDPRRNLYLLGELMLATGNVDAAAEYLARAHELGLPEAAEWLARRQRRPP